MTRKRKNKKFKNIIIEHINANIKEYCIAISIFIIGIIIGMSILHKLSNEQKVEVSKYVNTMIETIKNNKSIDMLSYLKNSVLNNIFIGVIMWFVGSTIIGLPIVYGIVAFKGFSFGYTVSAIIAILGAGNGILFTITTMLLQNIIFIPCLLALSVSATRFCKSIIKDRRKENIKYGIIKHTIFSLGVGILMIVSSIVEVYISTALFKFVIEIF